MRHLESTRNELVKRIILLDKPKERRSTNRFIIEGIRELNLAMCNGYEIEKILFNPIDIPLEILSQKLPESQAEYISMNNEVAEKLLYRSGIPNVLGIAVSKSHSLGQLKLKTNPLILVIESVEKPGNLGAMMRTADAAGIDAVILCDPVTDIYNANVVRSSLGCIFSVPVAVATTQEVISYLKEKVITTYAAHLEATNYHFNYDFTAPTALVVGAEDQGLSTTWEIEADIKIKIPMLGQHDSMNVSNAAAVLLFEAVRQRVTKLEIRS